MFTSINVNQYPVIFMKDVQGDILEAILEFMYVGEVNVSQRNLNAFVKTARILKIKGLSFIEDNSNESLSKKRPNSSIPWTSPNKKMKNMHYEQNGHEDEDEDDNYNADGPSNSLENQSLNSLSTSYNRKSSLEKDYFASSQESLSSLKTSKQSTLNNLVSSDFENNEIDSSTKLAKTTDKQVGSMKFVFFISFEVQG